MNFTGFLFASKQECLRVAGVNEDGRLGFPTDPPVSELPVAPLSAFVSPLTLNCRFTRV